MGSIWNNSAPEGLVQAARPPWSHGSGVDTRIIAQRRTHCLGERAFRPRAALRHCSVHGPLQARIWSGSPFPPAEDLPDSGTEPRPLVSPAVAGGSFTTEPPRKPAPCRFLPGASQGQSSPAGSSPRDVAEQQARPGVWPSHRQTQRVPRRNWVTSLVICFPLEPHVI